jgi:hypothetical protein
VENAGPDGNDPASRFRAFLLVSSLASALAPSSPSSSSPSSSFPPKLAYPASYTFFSYPTLILVRDPHSWTSLSKSLNFSLPRKPTGLPRFHLETRLSPAT